MKKIKPSFFAVACITLFFTGTCSVFAQTLDETWFKLHVSAKGSAVEIDNETISSNNSKKHVKTIACLHLLWDIQANEYRSMLHCEVEPEAWEITASRAIPALLTTFSGRIKLKRNEAGSLKNASFSTLAANTRHTDC